MSIFIVILGLLGVMSGGCTVLQNIGKTAKWVDVHGAGAEYSTGSADPDPTGPRRSPTAQDPP